MPLAFELEVKGLALRLPEAVPQETDPPHRAGLTGQC